MQRNSYSTSMNFSTCPEESVDVNYNLDYKNSDHFKDSNVTDSDQNFKGTNNNKQEINYDCTALDIDRLSISDGKDVPRTVIGIQDLGSDNNKGPGKWLALDRSPPTPRYVVLLCRNLML